MSVFFPERLWKWTVQKQCNLSNRFTDRGYRCICTSGFEGKYCEIGKLKLVRCSFTRNFPNCSYKAGQNSRVYSPADAQNGLRIKLELIYFPMCGQAVINSFWQNFLRQITWYRPRDMNRGLLVFKWLLLSWPAWKLKVCSASASNQTSWLLISVFTWFKESLEVASLNRLICV